MELPKKQGTWSILGVVSVKGVQRSSFSKGFNERLKHHLRVFPLKSVRFTGSYPLLLQRLILVVDEMMPQILNSTFLFCFYSAFGSCNWRQYTSRFPVSLPSQLLDQKDLLSFGTVISLFFNCIIFRIGFAFVALDYMQLKETSMLFEAWKLSSATHLTFSTFCG